MAFDASFSVVQSGVATLIFTDDSSGSDATITERRIFLQKYDGTYLVPSGTTTDYIVWDIDDSSITLTDILDRDYALNISVVWVTPTPDPGNTYEYEILTVYDAYAYVFGGSILAQRLARQPLYAQAPQFNQNEAVLLVNILQAEKAITVIQNIGLSQGALDVTYYMANNTKFFF